MENQCVYIAKQKKDIFNQSFAPTKVHPIRPNSKRVTLWIEEIKPNKPVNSLEGMSCSVNTLGIQYERLKAELSNFEVAPVIDEMFYFLLGTESLTFYCKNKGKTYKVSTSFKQIPSNEWPNAIQSQKRI